MIIRYLDNRKKIMVALETPICDFGWKAPEFNLIGIDNKYYSFQDVKGPKGTLVMFICNHCPYVKSVIHRIVEDVTLLKEKGIGVIAIMSNDVNDPKYGEEDSFDNMKLFSEKNNFIFPYVYDETQNIDRAKIIEDNKKVIIKKCETSDDIECKAVSYPNLTLPTICSG